MTAQPFYSPPRFPPLAHSLSTFFLNFPVEVLGNSSKISISLGTMKRLIPLLCLAHSMMSSPVRLLLPEEDEDEEEGDFLTVMKALGRSPQWVSGTATQAASRICGWVTSIDSRAREEMFSPPAIIIVVSGQVCGCSIERLWGNMVWED